MKKLLTLNLLLLTVLFASAQYRGGIEAGANMMNADVTLTDALDTESSWGIRLGYVAEYQVSTNFFIKSGLLINQKGFQFGDERWGLNAIDLPINLGLSFPISENKLNWFIDGGLNLEYNSRAFTKIDDELVTLSIGSEEDDIKAFATGVNVGTGVEFNNKLKLRLSYYNGLTNLVRTTNDNWTNQVIGLGLHYFFTKK